MDALARPPLLGAGGDEVNIVDNSLQKREIKGREISGGDAKTTEPVGWRGQ